MTFLPRPWSSLAIQDNGEPLQDLPASLQRLEPHPYLSLGAPYGPGASPFRLRSGVIDRLLAAQAQLRAQAQLAVPPPADGPQESGQRGWRLAIFDAWRPVAVQRFMVEVTTAAECRQRGLDPLGSGPAWQAVQQEVGRFWASPSLDPATPPPHSTGGAVDLTLADATGRPLDMGGAIDAIGAVSEPGHYGAQSAVDPDGMAARWHARRLRLSAAMASAGFAQHPNEWWHFSYGDQLWAWDQGQSTAIYGRVPELPD